MQQDKSNIGFIALAIVILFIILFGISKAKAQSNFFKYSTIYFSGIIESPLKEQSNYQVIRNDDFIGIPQIINTTEVNDFNYRITLGIRKIARFKYENRANVWYDGSEENISNQAPIGAVKGFEYVAEYSMVRNRGEEFVEQDYWLRHLGDHTLAKVEFSDNQAVQLKHIALEFRGRYKINNFNLTAGVKHRTHPVYGFDPFRENFDLVTDQWWTIAYDLGYIDEHWSISEMGDFNWYDGEGNLIAESDQEFMKYHFGRAISEYNRKYLEDLGLQQELSAVFGLSYYLFQKNFWIHYWADIMPLHKGLSEHSFANLDHPEDVEGIPLNYDWDLGFIIGTKLTKKLGVFAEGFYQRYWGIKNYNLQFGINYLFR